MGRGEERRLSVQARGPPFASWAARAPRNSSCTHRKGRHGSRRIPQCAVRAQAGEGPGPSRRRVVPVSPPARSQVTEPLSEASSDVCAGPGSLSLRLLQARGPKEAAVPSARVFEGRTSRPACPLGL